MWRPRQRHFWAAIKHEMKPLVWLPLILSVWLVLLLQPGHIEGRLLPAASPMTLDRLEAGARAQALVWGRSARLRRECSYRKVRWYLGRRSGQSVPVAIDTGPAILRKDGAFSFGPWVLGMPATLVREDSFSDVYHQCRLFGLELPWLTKSRFWN